MGANATKEEYQPSIPFHPHTWTAIRLLWCRFTMTEPQVEWGLDENDPRLWKPYINEALRKVDQAQKKLEFCLLPLEFNDPNRKFRERLSRALPDDILLWIKEVGEPDEPRYGYKWLSRERMHKTEKGTLWYDSRLEAYYWDVEGIWTWCTPEMAAAVAGAEYVDGVLHKC